MGAKQTQISADLTIIGGGAAGLTLAVLLGDAGMKVALVDPAPPAPLKDTDISGRTVALMNSSLAVLKACDVWDALKDHSNPLQMMRIIDDSDPVREPIDVEFPASDIGAAQFGYNIPNSLLRAALFERVKALKNIRFVEGMFEGYETTSSGVSVSLQSGEQIVSKLLIGADGRTSPVREAAGIEASTTHYDQAAMTFVINHSRSHENISTEFHRENGPMALVPMPGNQCSVVWVESKEKVEALLHLKKQELEQAFQDKTHNLLGGVTLETGPQSWPLCTIKAKSLTAPRVALVAEAAHVMSPITAQGLNLSLRDVAALAETMLDAARLGQDIGCAQTLKAYAKRRRADIETRVFGVDAMNKIVSSPVLGLKRLRRAGLKSLDTLPFIKSVAMEVGLAPSMDEGRLLKGDAL